MYHRLLKDPAIRGHAWHVERGSRAYLRIHGRYAGPKFERELSATLARASFLGVPMPVLIFVLIFAILWVVLNHTTYGRSVYAVGGNVKSARTAGIATNPVTASVYVIAGLLAGLGGLILTARTSSALPQAGVSYELDAIAAVVIGGTSLSGGVGSIAGTLLGALIIGTINNGFDLLGVSSAYQQIVKGCIIVVAVLLDYSRHSNE